MEKMTGGGSEIRSDGSDLADLRSCVELQQELGWATDGDEMAMACVEIRHRSVIKAMRS
ncbi:hypothetical protein TIFTF001_024789 [Ficus carica]|uniref:Uncharacterized protein n=1 Tax=Ficus carica TaxID=3494 RepID=A0AA88DF28_FICCA|nr:hypothetical protein TIFTF001_024789 [Ficus carica]